MKEKMKELGKKSAVCSLWLSLMLTSVLALTVPAFAVPEAEVLTVKGSCVDVWDISASGQETWLNYFCDVPLTAIAMGDIDGDGLAEVVTAGNNNVVVWDISANGYATILRVFGYGLVTSIAMGDIDGDGTAELVTAKGNCVDVWDISASGIETPLDYFCMDANLTAIAMGDIDGDGTAELLTAKGNCVDVFDISATGQETWLNYFCDVPLTAIAMGDIDGDGLAEVVTAGNNNNVVVWDISANGYATILRVFGYGLVTSMAMGDIDGDGIAELLTAKNNCVDVFDISATGIETPLDYFCMDANLTAIAIKTPSCIKGDKALLAACIEGRELVEATEGWDQPRNPGKGGGQGVKLNMPLIAQVASGYVDSLGICSEKDAEELQSCIVSYFASGGKSSHFGE